MALGRILKTQISISEQVNDLSLKSALLFTWLIPHLDDFGRIPGSARQIKAVVLPMREDISIDDVKHCLSELHNQDLIIRYAHNGKEYIELPNFDEHQSGLHKRTESKYPASTDSGSLIFDKNNKNGVSLKDNEGLFPELPGTSRNFQPSRARAEQNRTEQELEQEQKENIVAPESRHCPVETKNEIIFVEEKNISQPKPRHPDNQDVITVFEHWKNVLQHPNAKLDDKRRKLIKAALKCGYSPQQLCDAITGCSLTPHNIGQNESNQRYDGLHVILRDADQIDRFIANSRSPPVGMKIAEINLNNYCEVDGIRMPICSENSCEKVGTHSPGRTNKWYCQNHGR